MHLITTWNIVFFIAPLLKISLSVSVERVKTLEVVGFKITVSTRSTHQIKFSKELLSVTINNNMHYLHNRNSPIFLYQNFGLFLGSGNHLKPIFKNHPYAQENNPLSK